jgi:NADPH:quinone reductase-like Zn-dependent oxidoreductase
VILELVGGPHMAGNIDALARGGRLVLVAAKPGEEATIVLRDLMTKRAHLMGTTLRTRPPEQKAQLTQAFAARIVPYLAAGTIHPVVDRTFPLEQVGEALDAVRAPGKLGKLLLELP